MNKFTKHTGVVVPLNMSNIDTDAIIPKEFLKKVTRVGFGKYLFNNWRYLYKKKKITNKYFILNNTIYKNASILISGKNFGCGSSREHAVWALKDYGFKVIIASSFADIFETNSFNNQLLLITLKEKIINSIFTIITNNPGISMTVDLLADTINILDYTFSIKINSFHKYCMINGLDYIDHTLQVLNKIKIYENKIFSFFPIIRNS